MIYKDYNDNELIFMVKENSVEAKDILFDKYKYIIDIIIAKYSKVIKMIGLDFTDLYQDAYVGFTEAIDNYKEEKDASLKTFISLCVERKIQTSIKKAGRIKNKILNESLSLEHDYDYLSQPLMYLLGDSNQNNPLKTITENEKLEELASSIKQSLSDNEYEVYALLINGLNYQEIAQLLEMKPKQADNTIQRIRFKVKKIINILE